MMEKQLYLVFQPIYKTISIFSCLLKKISKWESKGLSNEKFPPPFATSKSFSPKLIWFYNYKVKLKLEENFLKQEDKAGFTPKKLIHGLEI